MTKCKCKFKMKLKPCELTSKKLLEVLHKPLPNPPFIYFMLIMRMSYDQTTTWPDMTC